LTEWKKPGLLGHFAADDNVGSSDVTPKKGGKAKKGAAKVAMAIL